MDIKQEILMTPGALRETLEKGRPEYEAIVRQTRWGDGPIYVLGSGASLLAGLAGAYAFEGLLGWPVVTRSAAGFEAYSASVLKPRSVVLAISPSGESSEILEAARVAKSRGATLLAMTGGPSSALAQMADGVFLVRAGEEQGPAIRSAICQQAAVCYVGLLAAKVLKRHHPQLAILEEEFGKLPERVEWVLAQLKDAARSLARELKSLERLSVAGGGFYHPTALVWALQLRTLAGIHAEGFEATEFRHGPLEMLRRDSTVVFLSGSRCRVKKELHQLVGEVRKAGAKLLALTDSNDRELSDRAALAVLLPLESEMVGSLLALAFLAWTAYHAAHERGRTLEQPHSAPKTKREKPSGR